MLFLHTLLKSGGISEQKSSVVTKEQFKALQKYIMKTIRSISKEILSGNISMKPFYKDKHTSCDVCSYKSICQFDKNKFGNEYNYIPNLNKEEIWKKIET